MIFKSDMDNAILNTMIRELSISKKAYEQDADELITFYMFQFARILGVTHNILSKSL